MNGRKAISRSLRTPPQKAENYTAEEIRAKFDYEIEDEDLEYYRRNTCYNDIFEALALESWLDNHCTDVPFVTFAFAGEFRTKPSDTGICNG